MKNIEEELKMISERVDACYKLLTEIKLKEIIDQSKVDISKSIFDIYRSRNCKNFLARDGYYYFSANHVRRVMRNNLVDTKHFVKYLVINDLIEVMPNHDNFTVKRTINAKEKKCYVFNKINFLRTADEFVKQSIK